MPTVLYLNSIYLFVWVGAWLSGRNMYYAGVRYIEHEMYSYDAGTNVASRIEVTAVYR